MMSIHLKCSFFFFFNDTATTEIYTLSLHDALPISSIPRRLDASGTSSRLLEEESVIAVLRMETWCAATARRADRKSTRLNSSHSQISYAVFCLKKKKTKTENSEEHQAQRTRAT